ncbi:hypothetical protein GGE16_006096 [Rhizobium leguminosarum]|uniref:Uncharacterized protein n=1 Tax=Rhizobium leguminosarum TaxID=384 RepID=A0AAE2T0Z4_RHILE|nr:hypothetical protein [Rhizobium leguminosarum]MBB4435893.1 hypothetical protein [Rhizobium esperanzae]MBB4300390.1 hypothetical protein [Rhizobium leguminosarum]MBB4311685.1 hypothetical protein [Rhizobium leguminosarum]MBB4420675.1 hypothetical protein [Rhizobium leguminosarum]
MPGCEAAGPNNRTGTQARIGTGTKPQHQTYEYRAKTGVTR